VRLIERDYPLAASLVANSHHTMRRIKRPCALAQSRKCATIFRDRGQDPDYVASCRQFIRRRHAGCGEMLGDRMIVQRPTKIADNSCRISGRIERKEVMAPADLAAEGADQVAGGETAERLALCLATRVPGVPWVMRTSTFLAISSATRCGSRS
jgi:hypothetical protein